MWIAATILLSACSWIDAGADDKGKLEGRWVAIGLEEKGNKSNPAEVEKEHVSCLIEGNKFTIIHGNDKDTWTYKTDRGKSPAWLDLTDKDGGVNHAIYELKEGKLTICFSKKTNANRPEDRPIKLTTDREQNKNLNGLLLFVLQKDKDKK